MIVTRFKNKKEIEKLCDKFDSFVLFGCNICSAECKTSGNDILNEYKDYLEKKGKKVVYMALLEGMCNNMLVKREIKRIKDKEFDVIVSFACGSGTQVTSNLTDKKVITFLDTVYLAKKERVGIFQEMCVMCGSCVLNETEGICPRTQCSKGILNGPCGGSLDGKCEVDGERDCAWVKIYEKVKARKNMETIKKIKEPLKNINELKPRKDIVR